jgi:hypothetical protein
MTDLPPPRHLIFDIETGPRPDGELEILMPAFDSKKIDKRGITERGYVKELDFKPGNATKEETLARKLEESRVKFAADQASLVAKIKNAQDDHFGKFREKAALEGTLGRLICIGYMEGDRVDIDSREEQIQLMEFWNRAKQFFADGNPHGNKMIGHNTKGWCDQGFDLPFLVHRSWVLGLAFPLRELFDGNYWVRGFVDLLEVYRLTSRPKWITLDELAKRLGVGQKTPGVKGADFAKLWESDRHLAKTYCDNDVRITQACAKVLGCLDV